MNNSDFEWNASDERLNASDERLKCPDCILNYFKTSSGAFKT
ncbi:MAG: hypothetical protein NT007_06195 [Candidatus Kapabacteria bacterium]|nr:hypothetical protein [Candidatus Kapabacteria bacterium]